MDGLKVIPEVFFDIIGRVVPGAVAILAALLLNRTTWESCLTATLGRASTESSTVSVLLFASGAYVAGQALSPLAKLVQRVGEAPCLKPAPKSKAYDWLRLHHPEVGAQCAKIRAEFMMHNGLAAVLLLTAAAYALRSEPSHGSTIAALVVGGVLAGYRGRDTRDTFNMTVDKFERAAKGMERAIPERPETGHQGTNSPTI